MNGSSILLVLLGLALLVAALYKSGTSGDTWSRFKQKLTRFILVIGGILVIILAFSTHPGKK